jgi:N-acetylglucosaminyl-diphospho-decaprenol L-rhamnosyltransferase
VKAATETGENDLPASEPAVLMDAGAVIVAHDRIDLAAACIRGLRRWLVPCHIALVLNVPDRVDPRAVGELGDVIVVSPRTPQGYGANLNLGVRSLAPDLTFVILANDDVDFAGDSVARLIAHLRRDERIGVAGPALRDAGGVPQTSARPFPDVLDAVLWSAVPSRPIARLERIGHRRWVHGSITSKERQPGTRYPVDVDWVIGAAVAARLAAFNDVGGFDEDFFLYFEETDFCYRLWQHGWRVVHAPDAAVVHLQGRSTAGVRYQQMLEEGRRRFLVKRLGRARWAILEAALLMAFAGTALWILVGGCLHPATLGRRWLLVRSRWLNRMFLRRFPRNPDSLKGSSKS